MTPDSWVIDALGSGRVEAAAIEASRRRLRAAFDLGQDGGIEDPELRAVANALELQVYDLLGDEGRRDALRSASAHAFQIARVIELPDDSVERGAWLLRLGCLAVLGDRGADIRRWLIETDIPDLPVESAEWGERVWAGILDVWLRLLRKHGWADLEAVQGRVVALRGAQASYEPGFLSAAEVAGTAAPAWRLVAQYHLAKAAEILAVFVTQGESEGHYDIRQQLEAQFDRALGACARGRLIELESLARLLARTARTLVENSIWTVTRAVNSRVTRFVREIVSRAAQRPLFEMLPPQRVTLREAGLLGSAQRSVVVSLPTSSGKTLIAEFRILQALNQFEDERGWVAYLAPTRALVNQIAVKLRRDFAPLRIICERVSPALEVDGLEAGLLTDRNGDSQFRVLVTTPEKLDLMLRGGWEGEIGRPLTLVVVDEAHNLASQGRGIKLELLLATINRECRHAQFLLLTPFVRNAEEIARWLAPDSHMDVGLALDWSPNDRAIVIAQPERVRRGVFRVALRTLHTSKDTLTIPDSLPLPDERPLGLSWSDVANSPGKLAAATAEILRRRGPVIVLVRQPDHSWGVANALKNSATERAPSASEDVGYARTFLAHEFGEDYPLCDLIEHGVGVHHSGMSHDARALVEWLTENGHLDVLVATTTIAQGVNFPVSGIVLASHQYPSARHPFSQDMPPEDFWNIAGRAGRVDQGDLGIIALVATDAQRARSLETFVNRNVGALSSTLIEMVRVAAEQGALLHLETLAWQPAWSSFLQYLAHTYRQIGDHERFAAEVEQVLRGTLGFQALRQSQPSSAGQLVQGVYAYAERLRGQPLKLVDSTGFSWESVNATLARLAEQHIREEAWGPDLFGGDRSTLQRMMGVLLQVPELRENLIGATMARRPDGNTLARMVCDWVGGRSLQEMAREYFGESGDREMDPVEAMTRCCQSVFGRLVQTASWGLAALQSLTFGDRFDELAPAEQQTLRNLPARVYYGVNSDEAVALRLLGVPRSAAQPLSGVFAMHAGEPLSSVRSRLRDAGEAPWTEAMGGIGSAYHRVWAIIEGES
ncbi:MAG: DEAD/DEAH box helicase [Candidatus Eisenbacteria bacterium]|nr:DEAD/DEAH box helicase [Candidatus Eisenbacteria bacterium]